jgi:hypothetical protein
MELDDRTILQVNATMIAGLLIFISILSIFLGEGTIVNIANQIGNQTIQTNQTSQPQNGNNDSTTLSFS